MRIAVVLIVAVAASQTSNPTTTYTVSKWTGDNILSARQRLPVAWKFFGQPVDGYFVSGNGYITSEADAKTSVAVSTALPDQAAPRNSIFAFWTDFRMEAGHGRKAKPVKATIGALSADGRIAVVAEGPGFAYPAVGYGGADDVNYRFRPVIK
jgi:hypothetical protein